jgi:hypothetical protein
MIEAFSKSKWKWMRLLLAVRGALAAAAAGVVGAVATFVTSRRAQHLLAAKPVT